MQFIGQNKKRPLYLRLLIIGGVLVCCNILANYLHVTLDLTEEKRYTLTPAVKKLIQAQNKPIMMTSMLDGKLPAGFQRLQQSTKDLLLDFNGLNSNIQFKTFDPSSGTTAEINERRQTLSKQGINPVNLRVQEGSKMTESLIYPWVIVTLGDQSIPVNLLENEMPGTSDEVVLNNSVSLLEYKLANAVQKLGVDRGIKKNIVFTEGHGELASDQTRDLERSLRTYYNTGRFHLDSVYSIPEEINLMIIARPYGKFSEKDLFKIDQYVMRGGKILWLLDALHVNMDSLRASGRAIPLELDLNLKDILYKYGVRLQNNLVLDMECSSIPLAVGKMGDKDQYTLFPWYYAPAVNPSSTHPIVRNISRVNFQFPSSIDTIRTKTPIQKTSIIMSSSYSRVQFIPVEISLDILRYPPDKSKFNKPQQNLAVLLEGEFPSLFEGRVTDELNASLEKLKYPFKNASANTRMILVSDGDIAANPINRLTGEMRPLGFNAYDGIQYANKDFLINCIEYLLDQNGVITARSKEVKMRLLDNPRLISEKLKWQLINVGLPLVLVTILGLYFTWRRKKRYAIHYQELH